MSTVPKKNNIIIAPSTVTTTQIAQYFDIDRKDLKYILLELKWMKRKYFLWLDTTKRGEEKGAIREKREILWDRRILGDKELLLAIKNYTEDIDDKIVEDGGYKNFIYDKYKKDGHTMWDYGKEQGRYNKGIDFIAKKGKNVLLIQSKSNQKDITLNEVLNFMEQKKKFISENPIFEAYDIQIKYIMSYFAINEEAFKYIQKNRESIYYKIIKY